MCEYKELFEFRKVSLDPDKRGICWEESGCRFYATKRPRLGGYLRIVFGASSCFLFHHGKGGWLLNNRTDADPYRNFYW